MLYEKGKRWEKAAHYSMIAGKRSRAAGAMVQAIAHFEQAEQQLNRSGALTPEQSFELDENLSYLYEIDSSYDKVEARLTHALSAGFDNLGWRRYALLQTRMAKLATTAANLNQSLDILQKVHDLMDQSRPDEQNSPEALDLHAQLCLALTRLDRPAEGVKYAEDGLAILGQLPDTEESQHLYAHLNAAMAEARDARVTTKKWPACS